MERWSSLFNWVERAEAWDRRLAEIAEQEWTAAVVAANPKQDEIWACRWVEFREEVWIELRRLVQRLKQLLPPRSNGTGTSMLLRSTHRR